MIGIERFWTELETSEKELSIIYLCDAAKDILKMVGSITVQEQLDNEAAGQTLATN